MVISWSVALVNSLQKHAYYKSRKVLEIVEYTVENKNDKRIAENTAFICVRKAGLWNWFWCLCPCVYSYMIYMVTRLKTLN